ncbi:ANTAR domain-containing response regulator [Mitsuokella sp. oral taxon 131]|uniref:ANTAR domain-containing response regulator n=1 Tax=Mitsuokella sp. oral taxon 131 TaxID=1321780 RepID=UPI0003AE08AB|nr:response regulator [Mitsuokella sp. oral taxon 131]ERL05711.1 response regulator receiver domain protein [Mitsuokella sp. oral taxon 131 str. W9106]
MEQKSLRLVIADNESLIRMDLREMLEEAGHEIVGEAMDGRKAVVLTRSHRPDLVIMDIKMPQMDGIAAAKKMAEEKLAPVLLLTAFSQPEIVEKAKDSGVLGYLVKPVQEAQLFPAMEIARSRWQEMQDMEAELAGLRDTLEARKTLDRAKGILMAMHHLSEPEAYRRIQQYAMMKRKTLKEIAEAVVKAAGGRI